MGEVYVTVKIMPVGVEVDMDKLQKDVGEKISPQKIEREPIAFGLEAIKIIKLVPEEDGATDKLVDSIKAIDGVSEAEVIQVARAF